ncbi:adhesion G-protein coupled receptor G6-like isoform X2 [Anneissia japonica]|uniref:adhesion G-protein coupled receptor G6-like isoform X2 n=1 Tax=Anneissia japonica TaxID=1529436 RepID=UPI00142551D1|nr:adhesion G-protein coupled receptor G6-like isoform X2 [Anneissia japonica]
MRLLHLLVIFLVSNITEQQRASCRGSCSSFVSSRPCQCDSSCKNGYLLDCCHDYLLYCSEMTLDNEDDGVRINLGSITLQNAVNVMNQLEAFTEGAQLDSEGFVLVANVMDKVSVFEEASVKLTGSVVKVVDNVIESGTVHSAEASSTIVKSLDRIISMTHTMQDNFVLDEPHLSVTARSYGGIAVHEGISFAVARSNGSVHGILGKSNVNIYNGIPDDDIDVACTLPGEIGRFVGIEDASQKLDVSYTVFADDSLFVSSLTSQKNTSMRILSRVLAINVPNVEVHGLKDPIRVSFGVEKNTVYKKATCVFWDFGLQRGVGDWSTAGCITNKENGMITCNCNHLTHFAVLVEFRDSDVSGNTLLALELISRLGCLVSIACLFATLIAFIAIPRLRSQEPQRILINLSISLLCLYILFVIGIDKAGVISPRTCMAVGMLLHYFTLTTIVWTGVEAINLYLNLVKIFKSDIYMFLLKACIFAWGTPAIIVIFMIGWSDTRESYRNPQYCFMVPGVAFFVSIIVPVAIVLTFNLSVFFRVLLVLFRSSRLPKKSVNSRFKRLSQRAQNAIGISVLLGLSWFFGFMTFDTEHDYIFDILFCLMNSLQGLFIFVFFCLKQKEVRTIWVSKLSNYSISRPTGSSYIEQPFKRIEIRS